MVRPDWAPDDIDLDRPSAARIYDYLLGGSHNLAVDRAFAEQLVKAMPDAASAARANRAFLYRAVRFLAEGGTRQYLDLGSGIPTAGNVHEVAQRVAPEARVVYVDVDPVAVAHSRVLLDGNDRVAVVQADLRDVDGVLDSPEARTLLDLSEPIGVLMVAILHAIPDTDDPGGLVGRLRDRIAPGSHVVIGHGTSDSRPELAAKLIELSRRTPTVFTPRGRAQVERLFDGFDLVEPGLVWVPLWRPEPGDDPGETPEMSANYGGVGRRR